MRLRDLRSEIDWFRFLRLLDAGGSVPMGRARQRYSVMVVGEETPDEGAVSVPKKLTIGYFRQDVEEMQGRSVLDDAIAGSGRVGDLHHELEALQREMSDPDKADDMDRIP